MFAPRFVLHVAAIFGLVAAWPIMSAFYAPAEWHLDVTRHPVGRDFVNLWVGGRLLWEGAWQTLFDHHAYQDALHRLFDPVVRRHVWSYPPTSFLIAAPLATMPYGLALAAWTLAGLTAFIAAARIALPSQPARRTVCLLLLAPATLLNVVCGQNGFFTAALMAGGVLLLDRRPVMAGILIGALSFKPHFGIVLAPALLALGAWRTVAAAAATAATMVIASMAMYGVEPWAAFLLKTLPYQQKALSNFDGFFITMLVSIYAGLRGATLSHDAALAGQTVIAAAAIAACAFAVRRTDDPDTRLALVAAATFLATPYALTYDLPVIALVIARLVARKPRGTWTPAEAAIYGGAWAIPLASMPLFIIGLPTSPFLMAGIFVLSVLPCVAPVPPLRLPCAETSTSGAATSRL